MSEPPSDFGTDAISKHLAANSIALHAMEQVQAELDRLRTRLKEAEWLIENASAIITGNPFDEHKREWIRRRDAFLKEGS